MQRIGIFHAHPHPRRAASLAAAAKVERRAVARNAGEVVGAPIDIFEAKFVEVKVEAGLHVLNAQNGLSALETNGLRHGSSGCRRYESCATV